jgi:hypothetical protein
MATTGRYIEANGPRVYSKAYGEDEVLGRPGSPMAPTPCGTRRAYRASSRYSAWPTSSLPTRQTMPVHNAVKEMNKPTTGDGL